MNDLDGLLSEWAAARQLTAPQVARVRANVLAQVEAEFDSDWFWSLLRPVTALLDQTGSRVRRRLEPPTTRVPYLQLA